MTGDLALERKFWQALKSERTMMLGLVSVDEAHVRPMTGLVEADEGPIWFFTSKDNGIVKNISRHNAGIATFTSKGHDIFATVHGTIKLDNDRAVIDRLWNPYIAAWYEGGKDDPDLALLRFDAEEGEIWKNGSSLIAGIKMLFGADPKQDYKDNVAKVNFR